jgi:ribosomal protein S18 acetylase RimI-like enzyme
MESDLVVRVYDERDAAEVVALWQRCALVASANDPYRDIALKLQMQRELFLVGTLDGHIVATVMAGYEGHRGWINYLAVSPDVQRRGFGRRMMDAAETKLRQLGAPKINLQVRGTDSAVIEFYRRLGFAVEDRVSMGKRLA